MQMFAITVSSTTEKYCFDSENTDFSGNYSSSKLIGLIDDYNDQLKINRFDWRL